MLNDVTVFNIREYLSDENDKMLGEAELKNILSEFSCKKNSDVERFLKEQSIEFTKKNQSVTYLVCSNKDAALVGYFTLSAYLIAQLGKNYTDGLNKRITGEQLLQAAIDTIKELQYMAGGMVIFLEAEDKECLMKFYEDESKFKRFATKETKQDDDEPHTLIQLLKVM